MPSGLDGKRIALAETRELDELARLIEQKGGLALRYPLVAIVPTDDVEAVRTWIEQLVEGGFNDVIFLTGEGVRRLTEFADRFGLRDRFVAALGEVRKITRGPKPARALTELGLRPDLPARHPTTDGIIEALQAERLEGRNIGVQLYGTDPNEKLVGFLKSKGANVFPVAPYRYAPASDDERVRELLERIEKGEVDAIAFTSAPQVRRVVDVASRAGLDARLGDIFSRTVVAAVGPVTAAEIRQHGLPLHVALDRQFFMKPLVDALEKHLTSSKV